MPPRGQNIELTDFSGGLNTSDPEYLLDLNQSPDLDNILLLNKGFKKRMGDATWNSSAMVSGSTAVTGAGYIKFNSGTEFLNAVAGAKFFTDSGLSGTMTDATGAVTITAGVTNLWTPVIYNNLQIWFGGAPDTPFKYSGSGNIAALGGTPPSAATAFTANNRVFGISTSANPSRIQWTILSNPEDWTGTGSGNSDVAMSDGEALQCGIVTGPDTAILFKNTSTHLMVLTRAPFPIYQLQKGVGIAGRNAWAFANGTIYFITPGLRMRSTTDGINFKTYPTDVDDIWDSIAASRIPYIQGTYFQPLELILFVVSTGTNTTNNYLIAWDLTRQCWIRCTKGFKSNVLALVQNKRLFGGHYNGKLYEKFKAATFTDASEATPFAIDAYWRTPFKNLGEGLDMITHPHYINVSTLTESSSTLDISYGFDFAFPQTTEIFSLFGVSSLWDTATWDTSVWAGNNARFSTVFVKGRGNLFSLMLRNASASQGYTVQGASIRMRTDKARKVFLGV